MTHGEPVGDCGCVLQRAQFGLWMQNCPLHDAAREMQIALEAVVSIAGDGDLPNNGNTNGAAVSDLVRLALAQSRGEEPTDKETPINRPRVLIEVLKGVADIKADPVVEVCKVDYDVDPDAEIPDRFASLTS